MSLHYLIYIIKIFSFDKIQMRWIRHNSVGKQKLNNNNKKKNQKKLNRKNILQGVSSTTIYSKLPIIIFPAKILRNSRITQTRTKKIMLGISVI